MAGYKQSTIDAMSEEERRRRHIRLRNPHSTYRREANAFTLKLDDDTLAEVMALAKRFGQTKTATVRDLIEWGIESVRFEDRLSREESAVRDEGERGGLSCRLGL